MNLNVQTEAVLDFLADRITGNGGDRGVSADAMIASAIRGTIPAGMHRPLDLIDLGRCCDAFARAPVELRQQMLPILRNWLQDWPE